MLRRNPPKLQSSFARLRRTLHSSTSGDCGFREGGETGWRYDPPFPKCFANESWMTNSDLESSLFIRLMIMSFAPLSRACMGCTRQDRRQRRAKNNAEIHSSQADRLWQFVFRMDCPKETVSGLSIPEQLSQ